MASAGFKGEAELKKALGKLEKKVQQKVTRTALRRGAAVVRKEIKRMSPKESGDLRREIRLRIKKDSRGTFSAKVGPSQRAFYARFIEYGTEPYEIRSRSKSGGDLRKMSFGPDAVFSSVNHPGGRARPFLRPGYERSKKEAMLTIRRELWRGISSTRK